MSFKQQVSPYLWDAFTEISSITKAVNEILTDIAPEIDTLVGTGVSGALVVPYIGRVLDVHWALVRKPTDGSHSDLLVEGTIGNCWVLVDDLIDTGETLKRVEEAINHDLYGWPTYCAGAIVYLDGVDYIDPEIIKWEYGVELNR